MERKLAAILAADVVGYSHLMEQDEAGTFERLRAHRKDLFEPEIEKHHGRIFKLLGDGLLAEFASVVDAVGCALVLQRGMAERNGALPQSQRIDVRIGINLGDVIVEGEDRHGDGVNIAARLQGLADPGGILISGTAYDQVKAKIAIGYAYLGEQTVKNIAEPVRVYRALMDPAAAGRTVDAWKKGTARPTQRLAIAAGVMLVIAVTAAVAWLRPWEPKYEPASLARMALPLPDKPSIAVLPFVNMSGDPQQEYFADGVTDDLITDLSTVSGLFVISRNSTFAYKGKAVPPKQVAEELGVRYVLEGSVQRAGEQLRINAQLIDALSGGHEWADRFEGSMADVFALQDKVTQSITDALALRLSPEEQAAFGQQDTSVPAAYDAFLKGWEYYRRTTPDDFAKAIPHFTQAIKLDPKYARTYAALAMVYVKSYAAGWTDSLGITGLEARKRAIQLLKDVQQQPTALAHQVAGFLMMDGGVPEVALADFKQAIALDPGDSWGYQSLAWAMVSAGRPAEAMPQIRVALRLDPHPPSSFVFVLGLAQFSLEQFEEAAASLERATRLNPDDEYLFVALAAAYGHLGNKQEAKAAIARYNVIAVHRGGVPISIFAAPGLYLWRVSDYERLTKGLRLAGVPEYLISGEFAAKNRLSADEAQMLIVGHRLHGHERWSGEERAASIGADGVGTLSGDWASLANSATMAVTVQFKGDDTCYLWSTISLCGGVFRNPGGTKEKQNEFIWYYPERTFTFSQVE